MESDKQINVSDLIPDFGPHHNHQHGTNPTPTTPDYMPTPFATPKLNTALAKAQLKIFNPGKNRTVDVKNAQGQKSYSYDYAELNVVTEIIRAPLAENGLTFTQTIVYDVKNFPVVLTTIRHESGEFLNFLYPCLTTERQGMKREQIFASGYTYAKRQALKGIFGIADDTEDTDGNDGDPNATITNKGKKQKENTAPPPPSTPPAASKPSVNAPAPPALMKTIDELAIKAGIHENEIINLVVDGYGITGDIIPTWVANEIVAFLKKPGANSVMVMEQIMSVKNRREIAKKKTK